MRVSFDRDQIIQILIKHINDNPKAFCLQETSYVETAEWSARTDGGCNVNLVILPVESEEKKGAK